MAQLIYASVNTAFVVRQDCASGGCGTLTRNNCRNMFLHAPLGFFGFVVISFLEAQKQHAPRMPLPTTRSSDRYNATHALVLASFLTPEQLRLQNRDPESGAIETLHIHQMPSKREELRLRNIETGSSRIMHSPLQSCYTGVALIAACWSEPLRFLRFCRQWSFVTLSSPECS